MGAFKGWMNTSKNELFAKFPSIGFPPGYSPFLFSFTPLPQVAFSLRLLTPDNTNPCVKVRRSSDNTLQDIYFKDGVIDTTELLSFVGAGNGFVHTLFDQSGNDNHAIQSATLSAQPQIVSSGNLILIDGLPSILFDGSNDVLLFSSIAIATNYTNIVIARKPTSGTNSWIVFGYNLASSLAYTGYNFTNNSFYSSVPTGQYFVLAPVDSITICESYMLDSSVNSVMKINGSERPKSFQSQVRDPTINCIGQRGNAVWGSFNFFEGIYWPEDLQPINSEIYSNLSAFYFNR